MALNDPEIRSCIRLGVAARSRGDAALALAHFQRGLALAPEHPTLPVDIANAYRALERFDEAARMLQGLLARNPRSLHGWIGLGLLARQQGRQADALGHFRRALSIEPSHPTLPIDIAACLRELGQLEDAQTALQQLLSTDPTSVHAWIGLGHLARLRQQPVDALRHFREALRLAPDHPTLAVDIASELQALGRLAEAAETLAALVARHPGSAHAWIGLGHLARARGDRAGSLECFQKALSIVPAHPTLPIDVAADLLATGRPEEARSVLVAHLPDLRQPALAWHQLGVIARSVQDNAEALRCFAQGIAAVPDAPECHIALVWECLEQGLLDRAENAIADGLGRGVARLRLQLLRVRLLRARGAFDTALRLAEALWRDHPADFESGIVAADMQLLLAQDERALTSLRALEPASDAQHAEMLAIEGRAALTRYDPASAERAFLAALARQPDSAPLQLLLARARLMRGDSTAAGIALQAADRLLSQQTSARLRKLAKSSLDHQFWREFRSNPFAERALMAAQSLSGHQRLDAIGQAFASEPGHAGTAIAWLVALRQAGAWEARSALGPGVTPIPRVIVQFWDTPEIPDDIAATMQSWTQACPGFTHRVFDDASAADLIADSCDPIVLRAFRQAAHPAMRSDIFRLAFLWARGGIYADADDLCRVGPEDWLTPGFDLILVQEDVGSIGNNFIAAAPGHPFIGRLLDHIARMVIRRQGDSIWFLTGPGAMSIAFCATYAKDLLRVMLPSGVHVRDVHQAQQRISMHLPRAYKQDARHWVSPNAKPVSLFRPWPDQPG